MKKQQTDKEKEIYIAADADVFGNVSIGSRSSIWYHAVIRAEDDSVTIGEESNIQDGCVLHVDAGYPIVIGDRVTVGHQALIHGCRIGDETLIGMGAIILNGAEVGSHCMIGAGALVTQGMVIPDGSLAFGSPAKVIRQLKEEEISEIIEDAAEYVHLAGRHFTEA